MAKGGGNRKPRRRKQLEGTDRKDRRNAKAPPLLPPGKVPPPPKGMKAKQREVWLELARQVEAIRVYADNHQTAFRLMVELVAEARDPDPRDPPSARVRIKQAAASALREFGLTPASQDRVSANPAALVPPEPQQTASSSSAGSHADEDTVPLFGPGLSTHPTVN